MMCKILLLGLFSIMISSRAFSRDISDGKSLSPIDQTDTLLSVEKQPTVHETTERINFICKMIEKNEKRAKTWWYGWIGLYGAATLSQGVVALSTKKESIREDMILGAGTTFLGVAGQLIAPVKSGYDSEQFNKVDTSSQVVLIEKLREAEAAFKSQSDRVRSGKCWQTHALSGAVNLTGGLITWIGFKRSVWAGIGNFALNTLVTEFQIWSQPSRARVDYENYCNNYGLSEYRPSVRPEMEWHAYVVPGGAGLKISF